MIILELISRGWRWIRNHKFEALSLVLAVVLVGMVWCSQHLTQQIQAEKDAHKAYVIKQHEEQLKADVAWGTRLQIAKEKADERIMALGLDLRALSANAERMSESLERGKQLAVQAPTTTRIEYINTVSDVSAECIGEYRRLAEKADGHATDVQTMIDSWPREPP